MRTPTAVIDLDVTGPRGPAVDLHHVRSALVLLRAHGAPVGLVTVPVVDGQLQEDILRSRLHEHRRAFGTAAVRRALTRADASPGVGHRTRLTVAVCTRRRVESLARCLDSLLALDYANLDLLVVDNDAEFIDTERLVRDRYPGVRYVREPSRGLDCARNRAIAECRGDLLAFADDDVVVDRRWATEIVEIFDADPTVTAVTGLVVPHELETDAQHLFEAYGGFGRGFVRRWYRAPAGRPIARVHGGSGKFGTGANMAYRRTLFDRIGGFDPALDVGTPANGGGDLDMFFRVLKAGHTLVYTPAALVRHQHRRSYAELRTQIRNNGVGFYAYLRRSFHAWPDERRSIVSLGIWWFGWWHARRLLRSIAGREPIPRDLILVELVGSLVGLRRYSGAKLTTVPVAPARSAPRFAEAIRTIDLAIPLAPIADATEYERLRLVVFLRETAIGSVAIEHHGAVVSATWLADAIAQKLAREILNATAAARARALPDDVAVSIVVATRDRPADLSRCLASLVAQRSTRPIQIIVVDNNPDSGVTAAVVDRFPGVKLVTERRAGLSYARNRGIAAAAGRIIVMTDDDVTCPPGWIEQLVAPFARDDVMVVTGNVLPARLDTEAERLFEEYGGLSRGFEPIVADARWFSRGRRAVPTWKLGCTANAAFRARVFDDPEIGPLDEALGAGTPTGCSEDTYLFYRVLKAGYAIAYEPCAFVWHHHRQTIGAVRRQIFNYSKGHVAYQLTTWQRDGDRRALVRILYELPRTYVRRAWQRLRGRSGYPLSFIMLEVLGCAAGPFALWRSRRRVRRLGASAQRIDRSAYAVHVESPRAEVTKA